MKLQFCFLILHYSLQDYSPPNNEHRLRHELSSPPRTLGSWIRIPLKACISVCIYSLFVLRSSFATSLSPVQGVLLSCIYCVKETYLNSFINVTETNISIKTAYIWWFTLVALKIKKCSFITLLLHVQFFRWLNLRDRKWQPVKAWKESFHITLPVWSSSDKLVHCLRRNEYLFEVHSIDLRNCKNLHSLCKWIVPTRPNVPTHYTFKEGYCYSNTSRKRNSW
jgi:hypothetical protein